MKKNTLHKNIVALLLMVTLPINMIACSPDMGELNGNLYSEHIANPDRSPFEGETLTIATSLYGFLLRPFADKYMRANPGVSIEVIDYNDDFRLDGNLERIQQEISAQLMANTGPVLMDGTLVDYLDPRSIHYFTDWFPIMDADPDFKEEDWFMNVFRATAVNGRLHAFPTTFSYYYVTVNSAIHELSETVAGRDGITMPRLMELYREIKTNPQLFFEPYFGVDWVIGFYIDNFVDLENRWVNFSDEFVDFIVYAEDMTSPDRDVWYQAPLSAEKDAYWSGKYYFWFSEPSWFYQYFVNHSVQRYFTGSATPIVNNGGELMISLQEHYVLSANASPSEQALAWDFIKFMMKPENQSSISVIQPTNRTLLRFSVEQYLRQLNTDGSWRISGSFDDAVESAVIQLTAFGEMPMQNMRSLPDVIIGRNGAIPQALQLFLDGLVSAEQTAANLQNQVELVLMEIDVR